MKPATGIIMLLAAMLAQACRGETAAPTPAPILYYTAFVPIMKQEGPPLLDGPKKPNKFPELLAKYEADLLKLRQEQTLIANAILAQLAGSKEAELLALNPYPRVADQSHPEADLYSTNEKFADGFKIIGRFLTTNATEAEHLAKALKTGFAESDGSVADCFAPRHGLRFKADGKTYVAIICFQCMRGYLFEIGDEKKRADLLIAPSPEKTFDAIFSKHGLPKAP